MAHKIDPFISMFFVVRGFFFFSWHTELGPCSEMDTAESTVGMIHPMLETTIASLATEFQQK